MPRHVAFIRAVMVGRAGLSRPVLLDAFTGAGAIEPRSHLATGNVSFDADDAAVAGIVAAIEPVLEAVAGAPKPLFVRRLEDLAGISQRARWPDDSDIYECCVSLLPRGAQPATRLPFTGPRGDFTLLGIEGGEAYSVTRLIGGRPGNPGGWLERELGAPVTTRNRRTLERIINAHR